VLVSPLLDQLELISNPKPKLFLKWGLIRRKRTKNNGKHRAIGFNNDFVSVKN
jgi:hypothetical protein